MPDEAATDTVSVIPKTRSAEFYLDRFVYNCILIFAEAFTALVLLNLNLGLIGLIPGLIFVLGVALQLFWTTLSYKSYVQIRNQEVASRTKAAEEPPEA